MLDDFNQGHYLEMMDRLHVIMCTLQEHCTEHPVAEKHTDVRAHINSALGELMAAYQLAGTYDFEYEDNQ